ncbi:MAG: ABC transporter ATP-binding protein [Pseudomonadota bacterium]
MALRLENVSRTVQGECYLDGINIAFERGSFNVLLGRTLAGKTSLMRVMAGLDQPNTGKIYMDEVDVTGVPVQKRKISMVYQQFINYPNLSVFENIASPLRIEGLSHADVKDKVESVAAMLHIEDYLQRMPLELSGGQQQRTAMARALVKDSQLILFDEPLVNLDYKLREELRFELRELFKKQNTIAIYASTEPSEALALGGTTTLMHEGRIIQSGPVNDVYSKPEQVTAAELFSEPPINIISGQLSDRTVTFDTGISFGLSQSGELQDGDYQFGLRPHHLSMSPLAEDAVSMELQVDVAEISGSETFLHLATQRAGDGRTINLVAQITGVHSFHTDVSVPVYFSPADLYVFDQAGETVLLPHGATQGRAA